MLYAVLQLKYMLLHSAKQAVKKSDSKVLVYAQGLSTHRSFHFRDLLDFSRWKV